MPQKSFNHPDYLTNRMFNLTWEQMDSYATQDGQRLREERLVTTTLTTDNLLSAPIYRKAAAITFTRAFAATPAVHTTSENGNTHCWSSVVSVSTTAATVNLFSASSTGTGKVRLRVLGK